MIDIALLGGVSVSVGGAILSGEAAQRRRIALLALLAAPTLRPVSRDRLIGWLWPDHDPESARHLLSAALHVLRRALGAEALVTTGDDVALNPALVQVDVVQFREALAAGDVERAVSLYRGEFMEGFFVNDAADFGQWVDGERDGLKRQYGDALERAASERAGAGNATGAAEAWRRRAAVDPYDARVALELMKALASAGQRGAAIQHARLHAQLLEQEFGAAPDPQVEALASALRQAPPEAVTVAAHPRAPIVTTAEIAPAAVAIVPVVVPAAPAEPSGSLTASSGQAESTSAGVLATALTVRAPRRRVMLAVVVAAAAVVALIVAVPHREVVIGVRPFESVEPDLEPLGAGLALETMAQLGRLKGVRLVSWDVAVRTVGKDSRAANEQMDSHYVLTARMHRDGAELHANLELSGRDGTNVISGEVKARIPRELPASILVSVAAGLGLEAPPESGSQLAEVEPDTAAWRHYMTGLDEWLKRTPVSLPAALDHFRRATEIDSTWALPWVGLANAYNMLGSYDYAGMAPKLAYPEAERAARQAIKLEPELSDAYTALAHVQASYRWDWAEAEANYQRALQLPHGVSPAGEWYAMLLASRGRFRDAKRQVRLAVEQQPKIVLTLVNRAHVLYFAGEFGAARDAVREALVQESTFSRALMLDALIDLMSGEEQRALVKFSRFRALSPDPEPALMALLGCAQARNGQRDAARAQLEWLRRAGRQRYVPPELLGIVHVALGDFDSAFAEIGRAFADRSSSMAYLEVEPLIAPLREDPGSQVRFRDLVRRVHK
jgi:DNA-binding SARP family transcriptional activator/tetratricopeptide (TPR) repeat protein/TolB-like protein